MATYEPSILRNVPNLNRIDVYESQADGYAGLRKALGMDPAAVIDEVKKSGLRGRGGAGFPTGLKWSFMPKTSDKTKYLACNGDEGEPGTFKDRQIFDLNPHLFVEGATIGAFAMGCAAIYVYIRGEYVPQIRSLQRAIDEAYAKGYLGKNIMGSGYSVEMYVHQGSGAYICGEETSMLNSLEGERPYPRNKPPFPAQSGLWNSPTTINNIETLASAALVMQKGAAWFAGIGAEKHPGPVLYGISGHVNKPGVFDLPTGMLIEDLIFKYAGGIPGGKKLKGVIPGGSSTPILRADQLSGVRMDADSLKAAGTSMGTAGLIVMDETVDMVKMVLRLSQFYHHESCGQCTPCREGTGWLEKVLHKIDHGDATTKELDLLLSICEQMEGRTVCALADAAAWPVRYTLLRFREEFEARVQSTTVAPWEIASKRAMASVIGETAGH